VTAIEFDDGAWPLVRVVFPASFDDADWDAHIDRCFELAERGRVAFVMDVRDSAPPSGRQRKRLTERIDREVKGRPAGLAYVVGNRLARGALTAILWMARLPCPYTVVTDPRAAERWAAEILARA
jgi:hypothetical protein